jgi:hypothetical protein
MERCGDEVTPREGSPANRVPHAQTAKPEELWRIRRYFFGGKGSPF